MAEYSVKCAACGADLTADSKEDLARKLRQHAREHHAIDMTEDMALQKVKESNPD